MKNKKISFILVGFLMLSLGASAHAQDNNRPGMGLRQKVAEERRDIKIEKQEIKADHQTLNEEIKIKKETLNAERKLKQENLKKEIKNNRESFKKEIQTKKEDFKKEVKTQKEEFKKNIEQKRSDFRGRAQEMLSKEFEVAVKNIEALQTRVSSRIDKEKAAGKDMTEASAALALSKTKLDAAKLKIAEVKALIPIDDSKITADTFEKIKLGARDAKDLLKEAHKELVNAVTALKVTKEEKIQTETQVEVQD